MEEVQSMFDQMSTVNSFISSPSTRYLPKIWVHFSLLLGCQNNASIITGHINMVSRTSNNGYYYTFLGAVFGNFWWQLRSLPKWNLCWYWYSNSTGAQDVTLAIKKLDEKKSKHRALWLHKMVFGTIYLYTLLRLVGKRLSSKAYSCKRRV